MSARTPSGTTLLLMEDDAGLARAMVRILELEGYRVLHAPDGHTARRLADGDDRIDLLIADLVLPGIGGREAANLIQAHHPEVKVLFTTGFSTSDPALKDLMAAGYPVLRKPYGAPELVEAVRGALDA